MPVMKIRRFLISFGTETETETGTVPALRCLVSFDQGEKYKGGKETH